MPFVSTLRAGAIASLSLVLCSTAHAQAFETAFPFFMPPDDSAATEFLPVFPADPIDENDRISALGDAFVRDGEEVIRFFGANLVADGAFPTAAQADEAAGRMRKMGFNLMRFHHLDNGWSSRGIFPRNGSTRELDPEMLDRLEYLIAQLKEEGIYVNMNLHVSRVFTEADGVADADALPEFGKGVTFFDPHLIALQKEYARQLLGHVNPHTGLALADDPVLAMVEITNENSLYLMWRNGQLRAHEEGGGIPQRHAEMLDDLWHDFLADRYGTTEALREAWSIDAAETGPELVVNGGFESAIAYPWVMEQHGGAVAAVMRDGGESFAGSSSARVTISQQGPNDWNAQWKQVGLSFEEDSAYTVTFALKAEASRDIPVSVMKDVDPWTTWMNFTAPATTEWQEYRFSFAAPETAQGDMRLSFTVGGEEGSIWVDGVSIRRAGRTGLGEDETLQTVRRIEASDALSHSEQRLEDMTAFYIHLQNRYFDEMSDYLKNELGVRAPITGTNWNFGLVDLAVQSRLDYVDNHAYWDHPQFPNEAWSPTDWRIENAPMVRQLDGSTIPRLMAGVPHADKPFTISEYNHAFPNRYQTEGVLFLTAYSAFHAVDGLMFFEYNTTFDWSSDLINGFFTLYRNPAMMALMPSSAFAYRRGLIRPAETTLRANYAREDVLRFPALDGGLWEGVSMFPRTLALEHAVVTGGFDGETSVSEFPPAPAGPQYVTDTGEIRWDTGGLLSVAAPQFEAATGFFDDFEGTQIGRATVESGSGFGTWTWLSLTHDPLADARKSLVTFSTTAQNTAMGWEGTQTVRNQWGRSPVVVRPERLELAMLVNADSLRVHPLDGSGRAGEQAGTIHPSAPGVFRLVIDHHATPTLWFGLEAFGDGSSTGLGSDGPESTKAFRLVSVYPNPAADAARLVIELAQAGDVVVDVFDVLGRRVFERHSTGVPGTHVLELDVASLAGGVYQVRVTAAGRSEVAQVIVR